MNIDPIAFTIGPIAVHWYGISYGIALIVSIWLLVKLNRTAKVFKNKEQIFDFMFWIFLVGVILGGRLGYVLFYNLPFYLQNPLDALKVWQGGMSFHGGLIGALLVGYFYTKKHKIDYLKATDMVVVPGALATSFGRVANFINRELVGREVLSENWQWIGVDFFGDGVLRYPSQLFQAAAGLIIFIILLIIFKKRPKAGVLFSSYFILQGSFRFLIEFYRAPDAHLGFQALGFTRGQWLSLGVVLVGVLALAWMKKRKIS